MAEVGATEPEPRGRRQREIAKEVFVALLADQADRSASLDASGDVLAGLGGVVTTLAGLVPNLTEHDLGSAGVAAAGLAVVLAVVGLMTHRPGREFLGTSIVFDRILGRPNADGIEDALLYADVRAAARNDVRLKWKAVWTVASAALLMCAVIMIVVARIAFGDS